jgi:hypothetical protein
MAAVRVVVNFRVKPGRYAACSAPMEPDRLRTWYRAFSNRCPGAAVGNGWLNGMPTRASGRTLMSSRGLAAHGLDNTHRAHISWRPAYQHQTWSVRFISSNRLPTEHLDEP